MPTTAEILHAENELLDAMRTGDLTILDARLHDDLRFIIPTGHTITKADDLANYRDKRLVVKQLEPEDQQAQIVGSNALTITILRMEGSFDEQPFSGRFKYLRTWQATESGWKVIGGAGISLPAAT